MSFLCDCHDSCFFLIILAACFNLRWNIERMLSLLCIIIFHPSILKTTATFVLCVFVFSSWCLYFGLITYFILFSFFSTSVWKLTNYDFISKLHFIIKSTSRYIIFSKINKTRNFAKTTVDIHWTKPKHVLLCP